MLKSLKFVLPLVFIISTSLSCNGRTSTALPKPSTPNSPVNPNPPLPSNTPDNPNNPTSGDKVIDFNVLTFNCWGVPRIAVYDPTKDQVERFNNITTVLDGYDLVNLQETFSDNAENIILKKSNYPHKVRYNNTSFGSFGSGLTSFSKFPIIKKDFAKFNECGGSDCYSNKGVFFMRITVPEIGPVDIYNTHYQAIEAKEDIRVSDNMVFERFLKKNEAGNLTIITGDFNFTNYDPTDSTSKALKDFKKRFNPIDSFRVANPQEPGFTATPLNSYNSQDQVPQRLDYIFALPENRGVSANKLNYKIEVVESKVLFTQPVNGKFLSDHYGLNTKFKIHILK